MIAKILISALGTLLFVSVPLVAVYVAVRRGRSAKKAMYVNVAMFFVSLAVVSGVFLTQGVSAAGDEVLLASGEISKAAGYIAAALAVGISGIAGGRAVATSTAAAIGALAEDDSTFGKSLVFVGLAEGVAIYGLLVAFIIVTSL